MNKIRLNLYLSKNEHEVIRQGAKTTGQSKNSFAIDRIMLSFTQEDKIEKLNRNIEDLQNLVDKLTENK